MCRLSTESTAPLSQKDGETSALSGFQRNQRRIEVGILALSAIYGISHQIPFPVLATTDHCTRDEPCSRPDLLAYKISSFFAMFTMAALGFYHWYCVPDIQQRAKQRSQRLFSSMDAADYQNSAIFVYQLWDICVSLSIPEHRVPVFLVHHVLALATAYCSLEYQMVPYYSIFFGGCSEISSVFLIFCDVPDMFVVESESMKLLTVACQGLFFLFFSYYRIFGWIYHSVALWRDCRESISSGEAQTYRPGKVYRFLAETVGGALLALEPD